MAGLSLQFHALPSEMPDLISDLLLDQCLFVVEAVGPRPLSFIELVPPRDIGEGGRTGGRTLIFSIRPPSQRGETLHQFLEFNSDALILDIGKHSSDGLKESWLRSNSDNEVALKYWKRVAKSMRAAMLNGAEAMHPTDGVRAPMKWHYFTKGALQAFADGEKMLPAAGNSVILLPEQR